MMPNRRERTGLETGLTRDVDTRCPGEWGTLGNTGNKYGEAIVDRNPDTVRGWIRENREEMGRNTILPKIPLTCG